MSDQLKASQKTIDELKGSIDSTNVFNDKFFVHNMTMCIHCIEKAYINEYMETGKEQSVIDFVKNEILEQIFEDVHQKFSTFVMAGDESGWKETIEYEVLSLNFKLDEEEMNILVTSYVLVK